MCLYEEGKKGGQEEQKMKEKWVAALEEIGWGSTHFGGWGSKRKKKGRRNRGWWKKGGEGEREEGGGGGGLEV